jgi:hypothetical protein
MPVTTINQTYCQGSNPLCLTAAMTGFGPIGIKKCPIYPPLAVATAVVSTNCTTYLWCKGFFSSQLSITRGIDGYSFHRHRASCKALGVYTHWASGLQRHLCWLIVVTSELLCLYDLNPFALFTLVLAWLWFESAQPTDRSCISTLHRC